MKKNIVRELDRLEGYTEIISLASNYEKEIFVKEPIIYGGSERFIILGMTCVIEVCELIIMNFHLNRNKGFKEMIGILEKNRVYPEWLSTNLKNKVRYIFTLKYDYLRYMNKEELYNILDEVVSDFRHFKKYILEYIY